MPSARAASVGVSSSQAVRRRASRSSGESSRRAEASGGSSSRPLVRRFARRARARGAVQSRPCATPRAGGSRRRVEPRPRVVFGDVREPSPGDRHHLGRKRVRIEASASTCVSRDRAEVREHGAKPGFGGPARLHGHTSICRETPLALQARHVRTATCGWQRSWKGSVAASDPTLVSRPRVLPARGRVLAGQRASSGASSGVSAKRDGRDRRSRTHMCAGRFRQRRVLGIQRPR